MKIKLDKTDKKLIKTIIHRFGIDCEIDNQGYIEVDDFIYLLDGLYKAYTQLEDKFIEYDTKVNEEYHEHFINEQIDKGMHPHEYE